MLQRLIDMLQVRTGVYLNPRFLVSMAALTVALFLFGVVSLSARLYRDQVQTVVPSGEREQAAYDAKMREGGLLP